MIDRRLPNPGECLVYFTGRDLASEREKDKPLHKHANDLWNASVRGDVVLYQRKLGAMYQYVAEGGAEAAAAKVGQGASVAGEGRGMNGITEEDVTAAVSAYSHAESFLNNQPIFRVGMRAAAEEIERRALARAQKPMHEPVSDEEAQAMLAAGKGHILAMKQIKASGNALLARRAAATRVEVVVTEEMILECYSASEGAGARPLVKHCLQWLADRLNGKHEKPVDPRVEIVHEWLGEVVIETPSISIADLLAKLDKVKP